MTDTTSFRRDATELYRLMDLTSSENVKRILAFEADKLKHLADVEEKKMNKSASAQKPLTTVGGYTVKIVNYAWDQSEKFVKLYVTFQGVHLLPSENIAANFQQKSLELQIVDPDKRNHVLSIKNLLNKIIPDQSYFKVKEDMVVLFLKKANQSTHWSDVIESEKKAKDTKAPKLDTEGDPSQGLMQLMKQMYDEGDDDMKRTIAKAWTEARDKKPMDDLP